MKNRTYTYSNPCYKSKIQYHMNKVNNLVNCAPYQKDPVLLLRHLNSLDHFVTKQAEIQQKEIQDQIHNHIYQNKQS